MHIDFNEQQVPDAATLLKFRHMFEKNKIGVKIFADVNKRLDEAGLMMYSGTIVDASLIAAPKSIKTRKANAILKCIRLRRAITHTSANMHDVAETSKLLREDDKPSVHCRVELVFRIVKNQMHYVKYEWYT